MTGPLRILMVEDSKTDAKLVVQALRGMGRAIEFDRVEDEAAMRIALTTQTWDLVVSDWSLPKFSGLDALAIARQVNPDLPFIIVSGTIGEEMAVEAMRAGAHDYVLKGRLARLVPAVERELRDSESRRQRRLTEEALRISEARFRRLSESGIVGISIADVSGTVHDANQAYLDIVGYSRDEMVAGAMRSADMTPPEWRVSDAIAVERLQKEGVAPLREKELIRKDGRRVPILVGVAMLEHPMCIAFVADLTQRKRAEKALGVSEEQFRQAQKMEAVGRLAGGIAHDFNNILSVILPYGDLLRAESSSADMRDYASEICTAAERAANLTRQLLMFSRQQVVEPQVLDLNVVIGGMNEMLKRLVGEDVELALAAGQSLGSVMADRGGVEQVVMNLVVNARDAMPTGGKLTIETTNAVLDEQYEGSHLGVKAGPYVILTVSDTGIGMDKATQSRIFEPFFTTKEKEKGTGLGLSTVFGIVQQSGGSVWVYSELGRGTTFKVYLPRVNETAAVAQPAVIVPSSRGTETILLTEDDDQVRAAARNILQRSGYVVIEARNGGEALLICEKRADRIHLLLTDVVMPLMSGPELAKRLLTLRPDMRVLCMSGYIDDSIVRHGVRESGIPYLQKPITPDGLARKVREVLDTPIQRSTT
jgi:two-component system cell cycle sensor histidine kinase/response regulator CckA